MKSENLVKDKSFAFAVRIVNLYTYLGEEKKEYVLSRQLLKSGTSIGANICESENGESKADFIHKLGIAQKETAETIYWLELLAATNYISEKELKSMKDDAVSLLKLLRSIILNTKQNMVRNGNNYGL